MKSAAINSELTLNYPDNCEVWGEEKLRGLYGDRIDNRWMMQDPETGIVVEINWVRLRGIAAAMVRNIAVFAKADETGMQKQLRGQNYVCSGYMSHKTDAFRFSGYRFEFDQDSFHQVGRVACFSHKGINYKILVMAVSDFEKEGEKLLTTIMESLRA